MLNKLDIRLESDTKSELRDGQVTYDCLMKLLEDYCSRMEQTLLK